MPEKRRNRTSVPAREDRVDRIPVAVIEPPSERCEADNLTSKTLDSTVFDVLSRFQMENGWKTIWAGILLSSRKRNILLRPTLLKRRPESRIAPQRIKPRIAKAGESLVVLEVEAVDFLGAAVEHEQRRIIGKKTNPIVKNTAQGQVFQIEYVCNTTIWNADTN
jgi:hypothetical protein